jgi:hypothetical protein
VITVFSIKKSALLAAGVLATVASAGLMTTGAEAAQSVVYQELKPVSQNPLNLVITKVGGSAVALATDNNTSFGQWKQLAGGASAVQPFSTFQLVTRDSFDRGKNLQCLDVANDSTAPLADIVVRPCDGTKSQKWVNRYVQGNSQALQNEFSGLFVFQPTGPEFLVTLKQGLNSEKVLKTNVNG